MLEKFFGVRRIVPDKLIRYGFERAGENFSYSVEILNQFRLMVEVVGGEIKTELRDKDTGELYTLHLLENSSGEFVGSVRAEYERVLREISEQCSEPDLFKEEQTLKLIDYIREKYSDEPEYLWEKFPRNAIFRRKDSGKWYAAILTAAKEKLGLEGSAKIEILNLKIEPNDLDSLVDGEKFFRGYHMNKRHWLTVRLDGSISFEEICRLLEQSYGLSG